jgi:hypothetical protein
MNLLSRSLTIVLGSPCSRKYLSEEQFHYLCCRVFGRYGEEMGEFSKPVNHHVDTIFPLNQRQPCNKIHRNAFPFLFKNGKQLEQSCWMGMFHLVFLTYVAFPYKLQYISLETLLSEPLSNLSISLQVSWMTCQRRSMRYMQNFVFQLRFWY